VGRGANGCCGVSRVVLLDNEAVQALADPAHHKHRRAVSYTLNVVKRKVRAIPISVAVPAAVRVEAGWDRLAPAWAFVNRLRIADIPLDASDANAAAAIRNRTGVSVADAHLGAAIQNAESDHVTVITSDPHDMRKVAESRRVDVVAI
jgi:predicted nucleic acid-binding protein